jgi:hypothetical protein
MMHKNRVKIRPAEEDELELIYSLIVSNDEWTKFNGPYFPYSHPSLEHFKNGTFQRLISGVDLQRNGPQNSDIALSDKSV